VTRNLAASFGLAVKLAVLEQEPATLKRVLCARPITLAKIPQIGDVG
jgi:hypothetical protein